MTTPKSTGLPDDPGTSVVPDHASLKTTRVTSPPLAVARARPQGFHRAGVPGTVSLREIRTRLAAECAR
jgi:hypothetical protein